MGVSLPNATPAAVDSHAPEPVFVALSKPVRLTLYRHLLAAGARGLSKRQLMDELGFTGGALTSHARVLQDAGLLEVIPESRKIGTRAHHRSGGFRCRARLAPLQDVVRGLSNQATLAQALGLPVVPARTTSGPKPLPSTEGYASATSPHAH